MKIYNPKRPCVILFQTKNNKNIKFSCCGWVEACIGFTCDECPALFKSEDVRYDYTYKQAEKWWKNAKLRKPKENK